MTRHD
jgi:hypothetical protein